MSKTPHTCLGISYGHGDSSAALVVDNVLVAAAEEERFTRVKHYALFPHHAIRYCLKHAGIEPRDVRVVAVAKRPQNVWLRKMSLALRHPYLANERRRHKEQDDSRINLQKELREAGLKRADVARVEHHIAHMMSARYLAGDGDVALFSFDGLGDFVSAAFGHASGSKRQVLHRVFYPHSLGYFYTAMTQYLGFPFFGDEFKVMGLSAYGQPSYQREMRELVREASPFGFELNLEAFPIEKTMSAFSLDGDQPRIEPIYNSSFLTQLTGIPPRKVSEPLTRNHWNLAKSVQTRFEEVASLCLTQLHEAVGGEDVAIAGGCAHNSVWVGKIPSQAPFKRVHVAPASHDAGIAAGAAILVSGQVVRPEGGHWALLGPDVGEFDAPASPLPDLGFDVGEQRFSDEQKLCDWMVDELAKGKIIGLCQGRLEFGPRALGSRSILADPRVKQMKERLNDRVKHREPFRPFAASVLWEYQKKWFKGSFHSPTMEAVFPVEESVRNKIPAVVHTDNSCRIQSVRKETQPFYWQLIETFRKKTGIPLLLNTSFNDCEPMVCSPDDAIRCFAGTDIDHLVIGNAVYSRERDDVALTA